MSFSLKIIKGFPERCDKCNKVDESRSMLLIKSSCKETGRVQIWVHLDEFDKALTRERIAVRKATEGL